MKFIPKTRDKYDNRILTADTPNSIQGRPKFPRLVGRVYEFENCRRKKNMTLKYFDKKKKGHRFRVKLPA